MIFALLRYILSLVKRFISYIPSAVYDLVISKNLTTHSYERLFTQISKKYPKKVRILDIGVGTGVPLYNVRDMLPHDCFIHGIDIDDSYIKKAQRLFKDQKNIVMEKLNFYEMNEKTHGKFDLVIFSSSFMLMPFREKALELSKQLLNPNGSIYFILTL
jgi:ubiquinone/menaquinone biosynthesis C-methylase UbiE